MPAPAPVSSNSSLIPSASIARRNAARLFGVGVRCPASNKYTVFLFALALVASSCCERPSQALAARHCSGVLAGDLHVLHLIGNRMVSILRQPVDTASNGFATSTVTLAGSPLLRTTCCRGGCG